MKAYEIRDRFSPDALALVERPEPAPGPGEVLVRVRAASLNYRDLLVLDGRYDPSLPLPLVPLSDGAGEVAAVGAGVTRVRVGDRVAGTFAQRWTAGPFVPEYRRSTLGGPLDGMLAEFALLREEGVVPFPEHLSFEEAATLPCAAVTAWNALFGFDALRPGQTVLTQGTGGVSLFALQFARLAGARVLITSGSDEKLERAIRLGAAEGVNYRTNPDWDTWARERTDGAGVDHVIDLGGPGTLPRSLRAVRAAGRVSVIGVLTGTSGELSVLPLLMNTVSVQGVFVGSRAVFEAMNRAIALHGLRPVIDRVFPFEQAPEAFRYLRSGAHFGKVVIRID